MPEVVPAYRTRYWERLAAGICARCGAHPAEQKKTCCKRCGELKRKYAVDPENQQRRRIREGWGEGRRRKAKKAKTPPRPIRYDGLLESPAPPAEKPGFIFNRGKDDLAHLRGR